MYSCKNKITIDDKQKENHFYDYYNEFDYIHDF